MSPLKKLFGCFSSKKSHGGDSKELLLSSDNNTLNKNGGGRLKTSPSSKIKRAGGGGGGTTQNSTTTSTTKTTAPLSPNLLHNHKKNGGGGVNIGIIIKNDDDSSLPTIDPDYNHQSSNFSLSDAGGTIDSQSRSLANFTTGTNPSLYYNDSLPPSLDGLGGVGRMNGNSNTTNNDVEMTINPRQYNLYRDKHDDNHNIHNHNHHHHHHHHHPNNPYQNNHNINNNAYHEELIEIYAPPGKLGMVLDTPDTSPTPIVHAIKDTCPIRDEIRVGDRLVAVDEDDVRDMTATEVSRLISRKSGNGSRKLTIIRSVRGW